MLTPKCAFFELTKHCNLNCVHCYVVDNTHRNELTTEEACRLLDALAEEAFFLVVFSGGEVLLRRDFFDIAEHAKRLRFAVSVFTNGTLITEEAADRFARLRPFSVEVSLHGVTPETGDAVTAVAGSYEQILQGVRRLRARGVRVILKANALDLNVQEVGLMRRLAGELGVLFKTFDPALFPRFSGDTAPLQQAVSQQALEALFLQTFRSQSGGSLRPVEHPCPSGDERPCGIASPNQVAIGADGYLYPCLLYRFHGFNLRTMPFREAYRRRAELIPEVITVRSADLEPCPDCAASGHYAHCFATAMRLTGDPLAHIPVNHRIAQAVATASAQLTAERRAHAEAAAPVAVPVTEPIA